MMKIESHDDSNSIGIRHTPNDEIALLELTQDGYDEDGFFIENAITLSVLQARAMRDQLNLILENVDEVNMYEYANMDISDDYIPDFIAGDEEDCDCAMCADRRLAELEALARTEEFGDDEEAERQERLAFLLEELAEEFGDDVTVSIKFGD